MEEESVMSEILTDEQVENWRRILSGIFGPYAFLMSREQIQAYRDRMQQQANEVAEQNDEKESQ